MDAPSRTIAAARRRRRELTKPEVLLWASLRRRAVGGFRFRKRHPIGPYVLDFYCPAVRLAVEVDGAVHEAPDQMRRDGSRDAWLAGQGVHVLRLPARYVLENLDGAYRMIEGEFIRLVAHEA
jgi:very-short-patch-repair endonuclease